MKKFLKIFFTVLGISIFLFCIICEIDGIGRFACIINGIIFTILGCLL